MGLGTISGVHNSRTTPKKRLCKFTQPGRNRNSRGPAGIGLMLDESRFGLNFRKAIPVVRKLLPFQTVHCMWQLLAWYAAWSPLTSHWGGWPPLSTAYSSVLILVIFHFGNPHIWCGRHRQCLWKKFFPVEKFQIYFSLTIVHFGGFLAVQTRVWLLNMWPCHWLTD